MENISCHYSNTIPYEPINSSDPDPTNLAQKHTHTNTTNEHIHPSVQKVLGAAHLSLECTRMHFMLGVRAHSMIIYRLKDTLTHTHSRLKRLYVVCCKMIPPVKICMPNKQAMSACTCATCGHILCSRSFRQRIINGKHNERTNYSRSSTA